MKTGSRIVGIDESSSISGERLVCQTKFRGNRFIESANLKYYTDSEDPTAFLTRTLGAWLDRSQISAVLTDGICLGNLNVIDIFELSDRLNLPVATVTKNKPNKKEFRRALEAANKSKRVFEKYGDPLKIENDYGDVYVHHSNITEEGIKDVINKTTLESSVPEALRVSDIITEGAPKG